MVIRIMVDGWEIAHRKGWCGDDDIVTFQHKNYGWQVRLTLSYSAAGGAGAARSSPAASSCSRS
ncbi:MAG: hypothetical protein R3E96_16860 [Planctomycetota bacterium]